MSMVERCMRRDDVGSKVDGIDRALSWMDLGH